MPKLYEYFGLIVMFYSNEHEPVHVHGKCQGRESRAEIILINGVVREIRYTRSRLGYDCWDAGGTTPGMGEVEQRMEQLPRAMQELLPSDSVAQHIEAANPASQWYRV